MSSSPFGTIEEAPYLPKPSSNIFGRCCVHGGLKGDRVLGLALINVPGQKYLVLLTALQHEERHKAPTQFMLWQQPRDSSSVCP